MTLHERIFSDYSKEHSRAIADWIGQDLARFEELVALLLMEDEQASHRVAWVFGMVCEQQPGLLAPHLPALLDKLNGPTHAAFRRALMRSLHYSPLPEDLWGDLWDHGITLLNNPQETIAVRVFAMTLLVRIVEELPELGQELRLVLEAHLPYGSAGFRNRGQKILKRLDHIKYHQ